MRQVISGERSGEQSGLLDQLKARVQARQQEGDYRCRGDWTYDSRLLDLLHSMQRVMVIQTQIFPLYSEIQKAGQSFWDCFHSLKDLYLLNVDSRGTAPELTLLLECREKMVGEHKQLIVLLGQIESLGEARKSLIQKQMGQVVGFRSSWVDAIWSISFPMGYLNLELSKPSGSLAELTLLQGGIQANEERTPVRSQLRSVQLS